MTHPTNKHRVVWQTGRRVLSKSVAQAPRVNPAPSPVAIDRGPLRATPFRKWRVSCPCRHRLGSQDLLLVPSDGSREATLLLGTK
jgi:hypothetical protein